MAERNRRSTDGLDDDIENMIVEENDPKQRAFLIVLNSINKSLIANTETIREVSEKLEEHLEHFDQHTKAEEALMNKGRGMWIIAAWVIGIAQIAGLYIWQHAREDLAQINAALQREQVEIAQINTRVTNVEKALEVKK